MADSPGKCIQQFDAEYGKALQYGLMIVVLPIAFAVHGSRPYGLVHLMGIGSGIIAASFQFGQLLPGSTCLRICEKGVVIRTLFIGLLIRWEFIHDFSVQTSAAGDRVVIHVDPSRGIGRKVPLYFTYRLPASELAQALQRSMPAS